MIVDFAVVSGASVAAAVCGATRSPSPSAPHRPLQRRRRRLATGLHRRRGRRRDSWHRRPVPPVAVAGTGGDLGSATERIHLPTVSRAGEDPRYADLLRDASVGQILGKVFVLQGLATWFISLPLQLSAVAGPTPRRWLAVTVAGVLVWLTGVFFEAVGDHQLRLFKADPSHRGLLMDRGLWAWTRHPNYFGDASVWWGLWLITITGWWSLATVLSPALMTYFLVHATGARLTEKYMRGRPGFSEYQQRTSFFIPRPPRSARS